MAAKVISFINLKGGVGKTTTAVGTAMFLAEQGNRVLLIDLDPQSNASMMLLGEDEYLQLGEQKKTVVTLFDEALSNSRKMPITKLIRSHAGWFYYSGSSMMCYNLDILPSNLTLIDLQEKLVAVRLSGRILETILEEALSEVIDQYKYVIIDCPPSVGAITQNGLRISTHYVIPVVPERMSMMGAQMVHRRVSNYAKSWGKTIKLAGVVVTKFATANSRHRRNTNMIYAWDWANSFVSKFPVMAPISKAAEFPDAPLTLSGRWGTGLKLFDAFCSELVQKKL